MSQSEEERVRSVLREMLDTGLAARPPVDPAELRGRATRGHLPRVDAKLVFAVAAVVVLVAALVVAGTHRKAPVTGATSSTVKGRSVAHEFSLRPALCYAPPLTLAHGEGASTGPLPACSPSSLLDAANLQVTPDPGDVNGYSTNSAVGADPAFATYASTPPAADSPSATVLLPGTSGGGGATMRYVLGPTGLTGASVQSATTSLVSGQWSVDLTLTASGSAAWDALAHQQFHQIVAVDLDGQVLSAPIIQPTQSSFASFDGKLQINGGFRQAQAAAVAHDILASR
jgi:hypothetical protein